MQKVTAKLFAVAQPVAGWAWPPQVVIDDSTDVNAYASLGKAAQEGGKPQPMITIHQAYLDTVVQGNEIRLAQLLGHELSHILLKHVADVPIGTPLVASAIQREHEAAADVMGFQLDLKAGYTYAELIDCWKNNRKVMGEYVAFEGLSYDHPSMTQRLANVAQQDQKLWQATNAFEDGVYFLVWQQYNLAQRCFDQVTRDFPDSYDGWANLGYARLMQYCDALEPQDPGAVDVGQIAGGSIILSSSRWPPGPSTTSSGRRPWTPSARR